MSSLCSLRFTGLVSPRSFVKEVALVVTRVSLGSQNGWPKVDVVGRLRPRKELPKSCNSPAKKPQGVMKRDAKEKPKKTQSARKSLRDMPSKQKVRASTLPHQAIPVHIVESRRVKKVQHLPNQLRPAQSLRVRKARNSRSKTCKTYVRGRDKRSQECRRLSTFLRSR